MSTYINAVAIYGNTVVIEGLCKGKNLKLTVSPRLEDDNVILVPYITFDKKQITDHGLTKSYKKPIYTPKTEHHMRSIFDEFCANN